jgi:hypothetical protein
LRYRHHTRTIESHSGNGDLPAVPHRGHGRHDKTIWILTLDQADTQSGISPGLRQSARDIRNKLDNVMHAANSDL